MEEGKESITKENIQSDFLLTPYRCESNVTMSAKREHSAMGIPVFGRLFLIECLLEPRGSPAVAWVTDNLAYTHFSRSVPLRCNVVLSHTLSCCESVQMTYVSVGPEAHEPPRSSLRDRSKGFPKERFLNMVLTRIYTHTHTPSNIRPKPVWS